jgi:hypothetical protein
MTTGEPWLTVVNGHPTDEELAAVLAVVAELAARRKMAGPSSTVRGTVALRRTGRARMGREHRWRP